MLIVVRFIHIVCGILWAGFAIFIPVYLGPAVAAVGPDGAKVMIALQKRGVMNVIPALGVLTLLSGFWLYWFDSAGGTAFMHSPTGMTFGTGGVCALLAFIVGVGVLRPAMMKVMAIAQRIPTAAPADKERLMAEAVRFRARGVASGLAVAILLLLAMTAMAVARYV